MADVLNYTPTLMQLDNSIFSNGNYREVLAKAEATGETNMIIVCSVDILTDVLEQLQQVGIMNKHYSYIVTSLDFHTLNLRPFQYSGVNITGEILSRNGSSLIFQKNMKIAKNNKNSKKINRNQ